MRNLKKMPFMSACADYFGVRHGQTKMQFGQEVKALNEQDRKEIAEGLASQGYEILAAGVPAVKEAATT